MPRASEPELEDLTSDDEDLPSTPAQTAQPDTAGSGPTPPIRPPIRGVTVQAPTGHTFTATSQQWERLYKNREGFTLITVQED